MPPIVGRAVIPTPPGNAKSARKINHLECGEYAAMIVSRHILLRLTLFIA